MTPKAHAKARSPIRPSSCRLQNQKPATTKSVTNMSVVSTFPMAKKRGAVARIRAVLTPEPGPPLIS